MQHTLADQISISGRSLHTGEQCTITFRPAPEDFGVRFRRLDLPDSPEIIADVDNVVLTDIYRRTTISNQAGAQVHTVEHILATLLGLRIDNALIELDKSEPPSIDGSARPFVDALRKTGIRKQSKPRGYYRLENAVVFREQDIEITAVPAEELRITFFVDFPGTIIGKQSAHFTITEDTFTNEIAPARTFCFLSEIEELQRLGLIKGGSLAQAVVIGEKGILNNKLRFDDEIVRHKILDLLGDLYLLGRSLKAHVIAHKSGHSANTAFVKKLRKEATKTMDKKRIEVPVYIEQIRELLPHRYPFLLVDRVMELEPGKRVVGIKNVSANEPYFQGHFPQKPIMPGVLLIEAMAQVGGVLVLSIPENKGKMAYLTAIDKARFRRLVVPGDQLRIEVTILQTRRGVGRVHAKAEVEGKIAVEAELMYALAE